MTEQIIEQKTVEQKKNYLTLEQGQEYLKKFTQLLEDKKLHQMAQKILSSKSKNVHTYLDADSIIQQLCFEFLRPVKGHGMEKASELHRLRLFNPAKSKFETYLYQCLSNLVYTLIDKHNRKPEPISYDNLISSDDVEENSFLNVIQVAGVEVKEEKIEDLIVAFKKTLTKLETFVFERLVLEHRKPKEVLQLAYKRGKIKRINKLYLKFVQCHKEMPAKFIAFVNKTDYFDSTIPESYAEKLAKLKF